MKIGGIKIPSISMDAFVIIRQMEDENGNLIDKEFPFVIKTVDFADFDRAYPAPIPKLKTLPGGEQVPNFEDAGFKAEQRVRSEFMMPWMIITAIKDTPGLEWEKVKYEDKDTWNFYKDELLEFMNEPELASLIMKINKMHGLDNDKMEKARKAFLASQGVKA